MFGICQNKQIIHEYHHHYYQIIVDPLKSRAASLNSPPQDHQNTHPNPTQLNLQQRIYTSKSFSSKNASKQRRQKGIHLSFKEQRSYQNEQKIEQNEGQLNHLIKEFKSDRNFHSQDQKHNVNLSKNNNTPRFIKQKDPYCFTIIEREINNYPNNNKMIINSSKTSSECNKSTDQRLQSGATSLTETTKAYKNSHQLKHSSINIKVSSPKNHQTNKSYHHHLVPRHRMTNNNKNLSLNYLSVLAATKPKHIDPNLFDHNHQQQAKSKIKQRISQKKINLYDDAKSIISNQNIDMTRSINIQESLVLDHQINYFSMINQERIQRFYGMCLAIDKNIGFLVGLKIFKIQNQRVAHHQLDILSIIQDLHLKELKSYVVGLYKILTQGNGLSKSMIFVNEPYQMVMDDFIIKNRQLMKRNHLWHYQFMRQFQHQLKILLQNISENNFYLNSPLSLNDLVIFNNRYKLHSIYKLTYSQPPKQRYNHLQILKGQITLKLNQIVNNLNQ